MKSHHKWALAGALVLLVGALFSVLQTGALWTASSSGQATTVKTGRLAISADAGGTTQLDLSSLTATNMTSGTTVQVPLEVFNTGTVPVTYQLNTVQPTSGTTPPPLNLRVAVVASTGACTPTGTPGTQLFNGTMTGASTATRPIAAGASEVLCLAATAPNTIAANQNGTYTFTFGAAQA